MKFRRADEIAETKSTRLQIKNTGSNCVPPSIYTLHQRALELSQKYREVEWQLVEVLIEINHAKLFKGLGFSSLFLYAVEALGLSEGVAYSFISVARKSAEVSQLNLALKEKRLNVSKAARIVSALSQENAQALIGFAQRHSYREIDLEVARINPKARTYDRAKPLSADTLELKMAVSQKTYAKLKRAQSLLATRLGKHVSFESILDEALSEMLKRQDPVEKAKRAEFRKALAGDSLALKRSQPRDREFVELEQNSSEPNDCKTQSDTNFCAHRKMETRAAKKQSVAQNLTAAEEKDLKPNNQPAKIKVKLQKISRKPLTAEQRHAVHTRDRGRCTHVDLNGKQCNSNRWLQIHHIHPVSLGGGNHPENLTTLCSFHHDLVHQLTLPLEGQLSWLKSPQASYVN